MSRPAAAEADEAPPSAPGTPPHPKGGATLLGGIANTRSWSQYYGSGFSIRVPPSFDDILEPEDFNAAMTYYGDKAKIRAYAARFASPDRSELVSVVIKPSNQLKITFLEAKDITQLGTLKEASKLFVPGAAKLYSARTIKVKDEEDIRTYYFYEFRFDKQHVALMATVDSGKTYIAAATAPETRLKTAGIRYDFSAPSCCSASTIQQEPNYYKREPGSVESDPALTLTASVRGLVQHQADGDHRKTREDVRGRLQPEAGVQQVDLSNSITYPSPDCEPTADQEVVYVEIEEGVPEAQAPTKEDEGVDYYFKYHEEEAE